MVIRDLTLRSAASFGSFHLIRLLYDEYMFYLVRSLFKYIFIKKFINCFLFETSGGAPRCLRAVHHAPGTHGGGGGGGGGRRGRG